MAKVAWVAPSTEADEAEIETIRRYSREHPDALWPRLALLRYLLTRSRTEGEGRATATRTSSLSQDGVSGRRGSPPRFRSVARFLLLWGVLPAALVLAFAAVLLYLSLATGPR